MLVTTSVPNLVNGVSQQAANLRFPSQCTEQVNAVSSALTGLSKRPPAQHVATLSMGTVPNAAAGFSVWPINRSTAERFKLVLGDRYVRVFDLGGNAKVVQREDGTPVVSTDLGYLQTSAAEQDLKALTVADYTILLNRSKTAVMSPTVTPQNPPEALVFLRQFRAGLELTLAFYLTPADASPWKTLVWKVSANTITTDGDPNKGNYTIKASGGTGTPTYYGIDQGDLVVAVKAYMDASGIGASFVYAKDDSLLHVRKTDNSDFRLEVSCTVPDGASSLKGVVQNFALLPKRAYAGFRIKVAGDPETEGDEYFLRYQPENAAASGFATGSWVESQAGGLADQFDAASLPHALVNMGTHFVYKPLTWESRPAGDADTNPVPSFVGQKIANIFFHRNRLGILSGENIVMSAASDFFRFFRKTVIQLLDDDPIDVGSGHSRISLLKQAVATSEKLVLFSNQTQFVMSSADILTPKTVELRPANEYENLASVEPRVIGNSVFFAFPRGGFTGFQEYAIAPETGLFSGFDITEHVPNYIPGVVSRIDSCDTENMLAVFTPEAASSLFIYRFYKRGGERLQSSWSRFEFSGDVLGFFFIETKLYLMVQRPGGTYSMEVAELGSGYADPESTYTVHLDRRITDAQLVSKAYDAGSSTTALTLPYTPTPDTVLDAVTRSTEDGVGGTVLTKVSQIGAVLTVRGDHTSTPLWLGERYGMLYEVTRPTLRDPSKGNAAIVPGRFQVRYGTLAFSNTISFSVTVKPRGRDTSISTFRARAVGLDNAIIGQPPLPSDGTYRFPVFSKNDQVNITFSNDTPFPCSLLSIDWEALYAVRASRL